MSLQIGNITVPAWVIKRQRPVVKFFARGTTSLELTDHLVSFNINEQVNQPLSWDVTLHDRGRGFAPFTGEFSQLFDTGCIRYDGTPEVLPRNYMQTVLIYFQFEFHMPGGEVWSSPRLILTDSDWDGAARKAPLVHLTGTDYSELLLRNQKVSLPDLDAQVATCKTGIADTMARMGLTNKLDFRSGDYLLPCQVHRLECSPWAVIEDLVWPLVPCLRWQEDTLIIEPTASLNSGNAQWHMNSAVNLKALRIARSTRELVTRYFVDGLLDNGGWFLDKECRGGDCVGLQAVALGGDYVQVIPQVAKVENGVLIDFSYTFHGRPLDIFPAQGGEYFGGTRETDTMRFNYAPDFSMLVGINGGVGNAIGFEPYYRIRARGRQKEDLGLAPMDVNLKAQAVASNAWRSRFSVIDERLNCQYLSSQSMSQYLCDKKLEISLRKTCLGNWVAHPVNPFMRPNQIVHLTDYKSGTDHDWYIEGRSMAGSPRGAIVMSLETTRPIIAA